MLWAMAAFSIQIKQKPQKFSLHSDETQWTSKFFSRLAFVIYVSHACMLGLYTANMDEYKATIAATAFSNLTVIVFCDLQGVC